MFTESAHVHFLTRHFIEDTLRSDVGNVPQECVARRKMITATIHIP
ncbi:MAG: hypothetical protein FWF09_08075 [Bacteroidales bacterium]|nr:hypothetical protein [Bacteroidales bacterium]